MSIEKQKAVSGGVSTGNRAGVSPPKSSHTPSSNDSFQKSAYKSRSVMRSVRPRLATTTVLEKPSPSEIRVYNEAGEDVTPKPLLQPDRHSAKSQTAALAESTGGSPTDVSQGGSLFQSGTMAAGMATLGPFTRSVFSGSISSRSVDVFSEDYGDSPLDNSSGWIDMKVEYKRDEVSETLGDADLDVPIVIKLSETEMFSMLELPAISVVSASEEGRSVAATNLQYQERSAIVNLESSRNEAKNLVKGKVENTDRYTSRSMNTFNNQPKNKCTLTSPVTRKDCASQAVESDIFDAYDNQTKDEKKSEELVITTAGDEIAMEQNVEQAKDHDSAEKRLMLAYKPTEGGRDTVLSSATVGDSIFGGRDTSDSTKEIVVDTSLNEERILKSESMQKSLVVMERALNLNTYQPNLAAYRNFPYLADDVDGVDLDPDQVKTTAKLSQKIDLTSDLGPSLDRLWSYQCALTRGRNVSCIAWNRVNPNLVAVGYGQFEYSKQKTGLVCCWSFKNPEFPERVYETQSGVMSVDFSQSHPNLLAVGTYNGTIAIYNVALLSKEPILDSLDAAGKHIGPVWQLSWVEKERGKGEEKTEVLVSISADGRVTQWAIRKGFESYDLMKLKRILTKNSHDKQKKSEAYISKYAAGLCFNFSAKDSNIYLAGTEDGYVHRCSCSYSEQYLDSYVGHTGPVYAVVWSPFDSDIFLSCSADWSIRLWHQERQQPVLSVFSSTKAVHSISWSPKNSTIFACVNEGSLEVWDLSQNTLDPVLQNTPSASDIKLSSVSFARTSDCVLVGDTEGQVTVYQLRGMPPAHPDQVESLHHVLNSCLASQLKG